MIFKFDDSVKTDDDKERHLLAKCLRLMNEKGHKVDRNGCYFDFVEKVVQGTMYMGQMDINQIENNHELFDVTNAHRDDYTCLTMGMGEGMYSPSDILVILEKDSLVVVENASYDSQVIKRWAESYSDEDGKIGDVNKAVYDALDEGRLMFLNAGGGDGTITLKIKDQLPFYGNNPQLKITTVFDSDKKSADDEGIHNQSLKTYLEENGYTYHCLVKREMENYFPLKVYEKCGIAVEGYVFPEFTSDEWDYVEVDKLEGLKEKYEKKMLPELAKRSKKKHFKQRVAHQKKYNSHYGEVDEIQHVLLMLAQYI